jgi:hypothetical protein
MPYETMSATITRPTADNYHALLFVGVCTYQRYVLSLVRWTNLLHDMYGYPLANIRVLVGSYNTGTWGSMVAGADITYNATRTDLDNALADYAPGGGHALGANDKLFIFTFNHGGLDGTGAYICCDNFSTEYRPTDFANRISAISCDQIVLLAAQCYSGGFVDPFINALSANTRGAVIAGCRSDQVTYEAICDKLYASAFNGRMVLDPIDDNIDLGISADGMDVYKVPGYSTDRIDWGPTGVLSTREAFNWVYDHYINKVRPAFSYVDEVPLYRQKPWLTAAGQPMHIRLGEADLIMQDNAADTGDEPSSGSPWQSPDLHPDNTDQFSTTGMFEYVPAHDNRFFIRTANRGTAPTDDVFRYMEVRGLGFTGGPVGPPRLDRAEETVAAVTASARLRPGRAHTQYQRILIGGNFGHGCVSGAAWCGTDPMNYSLWDLTDNDQVQCNMDPASVSGTVPVSSASTNSNSGKLIRLIPVFAEKAGTFQLRVGDAKAGFKLKTVVEPKSLTLKAGAKGTFELQIVLGEKVKDGATGELTVEIVRGRDRIGGVTFLLKTATAKAGVAVYTERGEPVAGAVVTLTQPEDSRKLTAKTDKQGIARFEPLNPGFYFANAKGNEQGPVRLLVSPGRENSVKLIVEEARKTARAS